MHLNRLVSLSAVLILMLAGCDDGKPAAAKKDQSAAREGTAREAACNDLPAEAELKRWLKKVPNLGEAGGLASGRFEWAAVVNRQGELCAVAVAPDDPSAAWPGSLSIAKAKAFTANGFSTDLVPMSTARLYTLTQPGQSLYGLAASNPFDPECMTTPAEKLVEQGRVCGGIITFGGGLPLYKNGTRIGGLGVSGDTACADHEIAKRIRHAAGLEPEGGPSADDIVYASVDGPSVFAHPLCPNTWRNGEKVGEITPSKGYQEGG